jgi:hypothetical protein
MAEQNLQVSDLSPRVVRLARELDRLPAGQYTIHLTKPDLPSLSWRAEIARVEHIRDMELAKREVRLSEE